MNDAAPDDLQPDTPSPESVPAPPAVPHVFPASLSLWRWLVEGLRATLLLKPRIPGQGPAPWQLLFILVAAGGIDVLMGRLQVVGPALFDAQIWFGGWWNLSLLAGLAWWCLVVPEASASAQSRSGVVVSLLTLWLVASTLQGTVNQAIGAALVRGWFSSWWKASSWLAWALFVGMLVWGATIGMVLLWRFAGASIRVGVSVLLLAAACGLAVWQFDRGSWTQDYAATEDSEGQRPRLRLTQQVFEEQQALLHRKIAGIAPARAGVANVYGLVFAPYASEDVFLRESSMVSEVLAERFDAAGRVLHLVNHTSTTETHPWATPLNLQRAISGLAARMDRERDLLVIYMTSHGASDFRLAATHWPLDVAQLTPQQLREMLDNAGIQHRVIAISACFSGGWVEPLSSDDTLVMTAADATHTSYGCGSRSELTFFGRAMFDEQLRSTHSFEQAFLRAVPVIKQREIDAGKDDGFSNPQIKLGARLVPLLRALEKRLDAEQPAQAKDPQPAASGKSPP
jgi:hypothetical protein